MGRGYPLPIPLAAQRLRRLELGASVLRPPSRQNPGYASAPENYNESFCLIVNLSLLKTLVIVHIGGAYLREPAVER